MNQFCRTTVQIPLFDLATNHINVNRDRVRPRSKLNVSSSLIHRNYFYSWKQNCLNKTLVTDQSVWLTQSYFSSYNAKHA